MKKYKVYVYNNEERKNTMKLTGYYMTAICKFDDGIKTICVVDAQNRAHVQSMDIMGIRDVLGLNATDGVI